MRFYGSLIVAVLALLLAAPAAADSTESGVEEKTAGARLFENLELAGEAGIFFPLGRLRKVLDPAPMVGVRATTSYYGNWRAMAGLTALSLEGPGAPASVATAVAAAGLEWRGGPVWVPKPSLALSLVYIRIVGDTEENAEYLFMEDGESEFGIQSGLQWIVPLGSRMEARAGMRWDMMFTSPVYSHAGSLHVGSAWAW